MNAGRLDHRVQFRRFTETDNGYGMTEEWGDHGTPVWASKTDISDGEKWRALQVSASITTRFWVRYSTFTQGLTPKDRLACDGREYDISGIKEVGARHSYFEITAAARVDQ